MQPSTDVLNEADGGRGPWPSDISRPVVTYVVALLCGAIFLWELWDRQSILTYLVYPLLELPHSGWPSIFTITLVHGSPAHLIFNLLAFLALGRVVEQTIGPVRYVLLLVALAWVSSSYQVGLEHVIGIGLSGVVYGVFGFMLGASPRDRLFRWYVKQNLKIMLGWAILCIVLTQLKILGVANTAHFSGLIFGAICGLIYGFPRFAAVLWLVAFGLAAAGGVMITRGT